MTSPPPPGSNPYAAPLSELTVDADGARTGLAGYAGFWRRLAAGLIDAVVAGLILLTLGTVSGFVVAFLWGMASAIRRVDMDEDHVALMSALAGAAVGIAAGVAYQAGMESSASQATVGKQALGVKVTDLGGRRISFGRALARCAGKVVSALVLGLGFVTAAFTAKKQALHDVLARTLVVKVR